MKWEVCRKRPMHWAAAAPGNRGPSAPTTEDGYGWACPAHVVPHLLDSAPAEGAPTGSEEGLGGQRQRLKSGSMMGENWGAY